MGGGGGGADGIFLKITISSDIYTVEICFQDIYYFTIIPPPPKSTGLFPY